MRSSSSFIGLVMAVSSLAAPLEKRADYDAPPGGDVTILNYALTLEYLERKFYAEGVANYTADDFEVAGCSETFYENLKQILYDEETHVSFLAGALGTAAVNEASYSFPSTDAKSFLALASVLEGVGVSAYLGAAGAIASKAYLTAAGSILTVESRHSAYIRAEIGESPFPKPFDTPLNFNTVFSLAAQFITGFAPGDPALPFTAFPPLTVVEDTDNGALCEAGSTSLTFTNGYSNAKAKGLVASASTQVYAVLYSGLDVYYVPAYVDGNDYVIDSIPGADYGKAGTLAPSGQVYIVLSTNGTKVADENTISGVGIIEVEVSNY